MPKPTHQVVTPTLKAVVERSHFARKGPDAMEYEPALYAAQNVDVVHKTSTIVLRELDQPKGDSYLLRSGG